MSVAYENSLFTWDDLLRTWRELDVPDGWRPEVTIEGISVTPPPSGTHNVIVARIDRQVVSALPEDIEAFQTQGVGVPVTVASTFPICAWCRGRQYPTGLSR